MAAIYKEFNFSYARNAEHNYFHENAVQVFTEPFASTYGLADLRLKYVEAVSVESAKFLINTAYIDTPEIQALDQQRDDVFYFLVHIVEAYDTYSYKEEELAAAKLLTYLISPYRKAARASYLEETTLLADFYEKVQAGDYATALATLHLTEAAAEGQQRNEAFNELYKKRSGDMLERTESAPMKELRKATDEAFKALADGVNALYTVYATIMKDADKVAELEAVIDGVNALIVQLRTVIAQRGGNPSVLPDGSDSTESDDSTTEDSGSTEEDDRPEEL